MTTKLESIDNTQDTIDSRDLLERIAELERLKAESAKAAETTDADDVWMVPDGTILCISFFAFTEEHDQELALLKNLAEQLERFLSERTLIRDSFFETYAKQFAEDIGAIENADRWPSEFIDWSKAADSLKSDFTRVDFDGEAYWVRG